MPSKAFSQELYDRYDDLGKAAAINHFTAMGGQPIVDPYGRYGVDLAFLFDNQIILVEPEVRESWPADQFWFPFSSIHIPERKRKVLDTDLTVIFVASRADGKRILTIPGQDVLRSAIITVHNIYRTDGKETFFNVPLRRGYHRTVRERYVSEIPAH